MNKLKLFCGARAGFSLLEVMVAIGLMGIAGYEMMGLLKSNFMGQKTVLAQDDARVLTDDMTRLLSTDEACKKTFFGIDPTVGNSSTVPPNLGPEILQLKNKDGTAVYEKTKVYGNRGLRLYSINIGGSGTDDRANLDRWRPAPTAGTGTALVRVDWLQTGTGPGNQGVGNPHMLRFFLVYVSSSSGTAINTCTAQAGGGGAGNIGSGAPGYLTMWSNAANPSSSIVSSGVYQDSSAALHLGTGDVFLKSAAANANPNLYLENGDGNGYVFYSQANGNGNLTFASMVKNVWNTNLAWLTNSGVFQTIGGIRPGSVATGSSCNPEGMLGYDLNSHGPVYCDKNGTWAAIATNTPGIGSPGAPTFPAVTTSGPWTVPAGVTMVTVKLVGGGGGGGGSGGGVGAPGWMNGWSGGGGGSGGYSEGRVAVTPGQVINVTIGNGGGGGSGGTNGAIGGSGGDTKFGSLLSASGGGGGQGGTATCAGGVAGVGSGGTLNYYGANGGDGDSLSNSVPGGLGAASAFGGGGRTSTLSHVGSDAQAPGSGGGGAWAGVASGGNGAPGAVYITY